MLNFILYNYFRVCGSVEGDVILELLGVIERLRTLLCANTVISPQINRCGEFVELLSCDGLPRLENETYR